MGNEQKGEYEPTLFGFIRNPFFQGSLDNELPVLAQFTCKSYYSDPYFKECKVLEHKESRELIIMKELQFDAVAEMEKHYAEFEKRKDSLTSEHAIRLRFLAKKSTTGMLGEEHKIVLLFDYVLIDLYEQSMNRMKQSRPFTAEEIGSILAGAVKGFASVEAQGFLNNKIRLKNIYFGLKDQTPIVKVADSNLFRTRANVDMIRLRESDTDDIFLSPEELEGIGQNLNKFNGKSGVYTLGMAVLQICLHTDSRSLYDYPALRISYKEIDERLNIVKNKYPLGIYYLLRQMTERSVEHRPTFAELEAKLPSNLKNFSPNMTLTVVPRNTVNNAYVKDTVTNTGARGLIDQNPILAQNKTIVPTIIPKMSRGTASIAADYRPQANINLEEVNELYSNGNAYKGQKKEGMRHGKGKYIYADGSHYYGDWFRNKMSGKGCLYYSDGGVQYDGDWKDDQFEGQGILYGKGCDWSKYEGEFKYGKMEGHGKMLFLDGSIYIGNFKADKPHGKGKLTSRDGSTKIGSWEAGKYLEK